MKFLFFILSLLCASAFAEESLVTRFRQAAFSAVETAEQRGQAEVQGIALSDLKRVIRETPVVHYPNVNLKFGNRRCAVWYPEVQAIQIPSGKKVTNAAHIYLNKDCAELSFAELQALSLHEFLGVGFNADRDYSASTEIILGKSKVQPMLLNKTKITETLKNSFKSGGSTGVGGGGDNHDFRFKKLGLEYLRELGLNRVFGVPTEMLELAIQKMKVSPARDIDQPMEFRAAGIEGPQAVVYIHSDHYRGTNETTLQMMALIAARLFVLYAPEDLGFADSKTGRYFETSTIQTPWIVIPDGKGKNIYFTNPELKESLPEEEEKKAFDLQFKEARAEEEKIVGISQWIKDNVYLRLR